MKHRKPYFINHFLLGLGILALFKLAEILLTFIQSKF